tara:strand:- start:598 stop:1374 length:777 start_codon:yes stop_codon:yes gene_type:complete
MDWIPVSKTNHATAALNRNIGYSFARYYSLINVSLFDLPNCVKFLPIVFTREEGTVKFAAVSGLNPKENLFVNSSGAWTGPYVPEILRSYPFRLAENSENQKTLVVLNDQTILVNRDEGEPLFNEDGSESELLKQKVSLLMEGAKSALHIAKACSLIDDLGLLDAWEFEFLKGGKKVRIEGLFRINQERLNEIPDEKFLELRKSVAFNVIYAHLYSLGNAANLVGLYTAEHHGSGHLAALGQTIFQSDQGMELNFNFD